MLKVAVMTLGCKVNWIDTETLKTALKHCDLDVVSFQDEADIYIINTCTVTAMADAKSRQYIRQARSRNAKAVIIAVGCSGEIEGEKLCEEAGADAVFGTHDRMRALDYICDRFQISKSHEDEPILPEQTRSRAFVKIQDGCNNACSYCIIRIARGKSRSVPLERIQDICLSLSETHREIVLAGIDIGQYGKDFSDPCELSDLIKTLYEVPGMARIRLSTLDPLSITNEIVELLSTRDLLCRHVHLSIQSCSDRVLKAMGRKYTGDDVREAVLRLYHAVPHIALRGDIIAGFPGETKEDHRQTCEMLSSLPLAGLHVFPFSARKGTEAEMLPTQISNEVKKQRAADIREISQQTRTAYLERIRGLQQEVVVTKIVEGGDGFVEAFSDTAITMKLPQTIIGYGELGWAKVIEFDHNEVRGQWN
jgi:threonylcarbamoyladenosine tRNA methylthiotransferase MtaB